ncbi:hypothetical protein PMAYCL1PPCAC_04511, partial [Pristionchus mayeri]
CSVILGYEDSAVHHLWWNDFATSFVSGISNYVSPDQIDEIGSFLFGKTLFSDAAHDVLLYQPTYIVFFWLGVIISVLSIVAAIVFLFSCARDWDTKKVSSKCMAITGLALSAVSLCFIVIGTALFITAHINALVVNQPSMDAVKT